ncbi:MAG: VWA domain-containing protein [Candidatus Polarisedimenticolaceae bacterium]|nr:VWA domain-containing protein [Candidatus Polarisedimenticolaceae bacterium]
MFELLHLQHPHWLWALLPLSLLLWWLLKPTQHDNPWKKVVDAHLLPLLMADANGNISRLPIILLAIAWLLGVLALADPVWEKQSRPLFQAQQARVIVLDLSRSMHTTDVKPNRLVRARFKLLDVLSQTEETETGLVVFAGDAFIVSPLTRDAKTINNLVTALEPSIMPIQGSRVDLGLNKAVELLARAGISKGEVLLIADGYDGRQAIDAARELQMKGHTLSVLGIGTEKGDLLRDGRGEILQTRAGKSINITFDNDAMRQLASVGGGRYTTLSSGDEDINYLLPDEFNPLNSETEATDQKSDIWRSEGPYLVLLLLPLAALAFRRGWLLSVMLLVGIALPPEPAMAFGWDDLWQRRDQQTANAIQQGDFQRAADLANDPAQKGTAAYRQNDYESALEAFSAQQGANGQYNRGNALAQLGRHQEAIDAYDEALKLEPDMEDAKINRAEVERLMLQQEEQEQQEQDQQSDDQDKKEDQEEKQGEQPDSDSEEEGGQQDPSDEQKEGESKEQEKEAEESDPSKAEEAEKEAAESTAEESDKEPEETAEAEPLTQEEQQAIEQWLRRIPDDPAGLLRRKFKYQYGRRPPRSGTGSDQPW